MNKKQLELLMVNRTLRGLRTELRAERRTFVARLWFQRMHHIVDRTLEWNRAPGERPEQGTLTLT